MHDFILNIDNKELLIEILHHSVDYLIGSKPNSTTIKSSHKFGFANPDDFEFSVKFIANIYKQFVLKQVTETELIFHFTHLNHDLQQSTVDVINARKPEVEDFLVREYNSRHNSCLSSFDWDLKWIMGSSTMSNLRMQIATLSFNCRMKDGQMENFFFEMNRKKLNELIRVLEECEKKLHETSNENK
ncbi:COMM domain-containing protein 8 [Pseudolycoriella hygida]|uniref:COMM domain-containing protein 8 n=1 Tax=Pseudolycoriella hygida TaxID=35572 RepID=A0A9Q0MLE3_9DIPT|nr:COMM domain-containing protein 8 [Pseudolycoriella hygida]